MDDRTRASRFHDLFLMTQYHLRITQGRVQYLEALLNKAGVDYDLVLRCPDCDEVLGTSIDQDGSAILEHYIFHAENDIPADD